MIHFHHVGHRGAGEGDPAEPSAFLSTCGVQATLCERAKRGEVFVEIVRAESVLKATNKETSRALAHCQSVFLCRLFFYFICFFVFVYFFSFSPAQKKGTILHEDKRGSRVVEAEAVDRRQESLKDAFLFYFLKAASPYALRGSCWKHIIMISLFSLFGLRCCFSLICLFLKGATLRWGRRDANVWLGGSGGGGTAGQRRMDGEMERQQREEGKARENIMCEIINHIYLRAVVGQGGEEIRPRKKIYKQHFAAQCDLLTYWGMYR